MFIKVSETLFLWDFQLKVFLKIKVKLFKHIPLFLSVFKDL